MAIAFDAKSAKGFDASSTNLSHTTSGSDRLLVVAVGIDGTSTISAISYAGTAMTLAVTVAPGNFRISLYYLVAPALGANNISVTLSGSEDAGIMAVSYTGVDQGTPLDGTPAGADDNVSPFGRAITTSAANSLVVFASADDDNTAAVRTPVASTNERHDVILGSGAGDFGGFFSDRITTAAGSYTMTYTDAGVGFSTSVIAGFKEAASGTTSSLTQDARATGTATSNRSQDVWATGALGSSTTLDARLVGDKAYTRDNLASLPTTNAALATAYSSADVTNVASVDSVFVDVTGSATYLLHQFGTYNAGGQSPSLSWTGKSTKAPSTSTVYLQIYNVTSGAWETLASDSSTAANTSFTLTGQQTTSVSDYYDANSTVWARVYQ